MMCQRIPFLVNSVTGAYNVGMETLSDNLFVSAALGG